MKAVLLSVVLTASFAGLAHADCTRFEDAGGYTVVRNYCSRSVYVRWVDQGACRSGCGVSVGANSVQSVQRPQGNFRKEER
jgi:hypothetical protein